MLNFDSTKFALCMVSLILHLQSNTVAVLNKAAKQQQQQQQQQLQFAQLHALPFT